MVPMRDGVRLATDVHMGAGKGPWPAVLTRSPYGRKGLAPAPQSLEDYVIVAQDVRGRFDSEGEARPFLDDGWGECQDGLDTVKWISAQPWCNGRIGTAGASALGITQHMLAGANPPGVLAQHINCAAASIYHHFVYPGGVFQENLLVSWVEVTRWPDDSLRLMLAHPFYDELWRGLDAVARVREQGVSIPAVHIGGWFDLFPQATIDAFVARSKIARNQWLIIGPWPHGVTREVGGLVFPPNAVEIPRPADDLKPWLDYWLKGENNGMEQVPQVQYYVMGACGEKSAPGNEWRSADSWPVPARATKFFLAGDGRLLRRAPTGAARVSYHYDPASPVPTRGGANLFLVAGPVDQSDVELRKDVLVFSTAQLKRPLEVTGRVKVRLFASCSARDTVFTAKLCDVYPDGRSMLLCDGALRAACRESFSDPSPLTPGRVYEFNIDLGSTSIIFNRGHCIRIAISSSNAPRFAVHPNVWGEGEPQVAKQIIYFGPRHPSAVILPIASNPD